RTVTITMLFLCLLAYQPISKLFDFLVYSYFLQDRVVLLQFQALRIVLFVFGSDVPACTWHTAVLMLSAFQDNLHSVPFLCHCIISFSVLLDLFAPGA